MGERDDQSTPKSITLKYFEAGHTFMAADSFHAKVEKQFKKKKNVYDFSDYLHCVREVGIAVELVAEDFLDWKSGLSQSKASRNSRPLLEELKVAQFKVGIAKMYFKRSYEDENFECTDFLTKKFKFMVSEKKFLASQTRKSKPTLDRSRKQGILDKLCPLMPADRIQFWISL